MEEDMNEGEYYKDIDGFVSFRIQDQSETCGLLENKR